MLTKMIQATRITTMKFTKKVVIGCRKVTIVSSLAIFTMQTAQLKKQRKNIPMRTGAYIAALKRIMNEAQIMGRNQHVTLHPKGWQVKGEGNQRATVVKPTQREATDAARTIAKHQKSELVVHGRNGQIRQKDSFGNDPFPPKG